MNVQVTECLLAEITMKNLVYVFGLFCCKYMIDAGF